MGQRSEDVNKLTRKFLIKRWVVLLFILLWGTLIFSWSWYEDNISPAWYFILPASVGTILFLTPKSAVKVKLLKYATYAYYILLLLLFIHALSINSHIMVFSVFLAQMVVAFSRLLYVSFHTSMLQPFIIEHYLSDLGYTDYELLLRIPLSDESTLTSALKILNNWGIPDILREVLHDCGHNLTQNAKITMVIKSAVWIIKDIRQYVQPVYIVKLEGNELVVYQVTHRVPTALFNLESHEKNSKH